MFARNGGARKSNGGLAPLALRGRGFQAPALSFPKVWRGRADMKVSPT